MKEAFLGEGLKFPIQVNKATGRFVMSKEEESIKECIYLILMTHKTERFMRNSFGSRLMSYTFMDISTTQLTMMSREIQSDIASQEPRIAGVNVNIDSRSQEGCLFVNIEYTIIGKNVRDNMVFPFYLNALKEQDEETYAGI